jgi:hypothetical protein
MTAESTIAHCRISYGLGEGSMGEIWRTASRGLNLRLLWRSDPDPRRRAHHFRVGHTAGDFDTHSQPADEPRPSEVVLRRTSNQFPDSIDPSAES